jgi:putative ATPase
MPDLFSKEETQSTHSPAAPLAERIRPKTLDEYVGQDHLTQPGKPLRMMLEQGEAYCQSYRG